MIYTRMTLFYFCFVVTLTSCDGGSKRIIGDFTFWHSGLESTGNIGYRSQSIIDTTAYVVDYWYNKKYIIAKTYFYRSKPSDPLGAPYYVLIHIEGYRKNPDQLRSNAVVGPMTNDSLILYVEKNNLDFGRSYLKLLK